MIMGSVMVNCRFVLFVFDRLGVIVVIRLSFSIIVRVVSVGGEC